MTIISLDGIRIQIEPPDLDGDGTVGEVEMIQQRTDIATTEVVQPTELGESLKELNLDAVEPSTRMSGIDMRARLHYIEVSSVLAVDSLVAFKFLPTDCLAFTRQKKRLSVSIDGKGRSEIVDVVGRKQDRDKDVSGGSLWDKAKGMFGGKA